MEDIDIRELFEIFWRKKVLIILFVILGAIIGTIYSFYFVTPKYQSSTRIILSQVSDVEDDDEENIATTQNNKLTGKTNTNSTNTGINTNDLTLNQKLVSTYSEIIKGDTVLSSVIEKLKIDDTPESLRNNISVVAVKDTQIIKITVSHVDATKAKDIANEITKVFEKKIAEIYHISNLTILDEAKLSTEPYNINHTRDIALFALIGFASSIVLILFLNMLDNTIGSEKEIENNLKTNILASIPECEIDTGKSNSKGRRYIENELIIHSSPKAPASEIFRTLRTNIQFMSSNKNIKTLLVTSTIPGEGKSWVTANLAITFAQSKKKVVIVDTDMRKGRQLNIFRIKTDLGLSNYLSGLYNDGTDFKGNIDECIYYTDVNDLYLIPAGTIAANPSELLASEKMNSLLELLKEKFDLVILDGTPCSIVTDSVILSKDVDATLIISAYKKTKLEDLQRIFKEIENVDGKVIGVVLNRIKKVAKRYQNNYYYYGNKKVSKSEKN